MLDSIAQALSKMAAFIMDWVGYFMSYFIGFLVAMAMWFQGLLKYIIEFFLYPFLSMLESIIGGWDISDFGPLLIWFFNASPILAYFVDLFQFDVMFEAALLAYFSKFMIRRIPVIG